MDGRTYRFPLYYTGLRLLRFPPEPLPCSHNSYHYKIPEQGRGTDDHILPLGEWFDNEIYISEFLIKCYPLIRWILFLTRSP